jgi:hypothetical protein
MLRLTIKINELVFNDCGVNVVRNILDLTVVLEISIDEDKTEAILELKKEVLNEERSIGISDKSKQCLEIKLLVSIMASRLFVDESSSKIMEFGVDVTLT